MPFTETIRAIPYTPRGQQASGYLPPILRAMGHVLYLTGCLADENVTVTTEEAIAELQEAENHWNACATSPALSEAIVARGTSIGTAIVEARDEYASWAEDRRVQNLRDLANRVIQFSCDLDRELIGLTGSDPGTSL